MAMKGFGNADLSDIRDLELENNIKLPNDYIDFLLRFNGGDVEPTDENSIYIEEFGEGINVDVLFGIQTKEVELSVEFWSNKYRNEMPHDVIIIGDSYQHGFIVLLCSGENAGIYYWDDTYEFECSNDENNTYFIADTFTDFVKGLI